jgi:formylglycine-generating enzyme required for sulfatase activity
MNVGVWLAAGLALCLMDATARAADNRPSADAPMVAVPGGTFSQGVKSAAGQSLPAGAPTAHTVTVAPFSIDKTEVTVAQFAACVRVGACTPPRFPAGTCKSSKSADCAQDCNINLGPAFAQHPMNCVTWAAATAFCRWAGKRLPTEIEWERAARGGDGRRYPWGKALPGKQLCWNHSDVRVDKTCPVGAFPAGASPYGVLDMAGNVEEWTSTSYDGGGQYVIKGGGFFINGGDSDDDPPEWVFRADVPATGSPERLDFALGLRCAGDDGGKTKAVTPLPAGDPVDAPQTPARPIASHPAPGSPLRKALLDAVRAKLGETVEFKVARLAVVGELAYFEGEEHKQGGRAVAALLRQTDGAWTVDDLATAEMTSPDAEVVRDSRQRLQRQLMGAPNRKLPSELFAP